MEAGTFALRNFGLAIQKAQSNLEEKKKGGRGKSFISLYFKSFQRARLSDVRKQQHQQSPPS